MLRKALYFGCLLAFLFLIVFSAGEIFPTFEGSATNDIVEIGLPGSQLLTNAIDYPGIVTVTYKPLESGEYIVTIEKQYKNVTTIEMYKLPENKNKSKIANL